MEINLKNWNKSGLTIQTYLILQCIKDEDKSNLDLLSEFYDSSIEYLSTNEYIKITDEEIFLRDKGVKVFGENPNINFDEFFEIFPKKTPTNRTLRSEKMFGNKTTKDYELCKRKYLSVVKNESLHKQIITILQARLKVGNLEYLNNLETYINKRQWEKDSIHLTSKIKPQGEMA